MVLRSQMFEVQDKKGVLRAVPIVEEVYKAIKLNRKAKYSWLQDNLGVSEATIKRAISDLKELGHINKEHSKIKGEWQMQK